MESGTKLALCKRSVLAPQAAETFLYLALIANQQKQPANAEALGTSWFKLCPKQCHETAIVVLVIQKAGHSKQNTCKTIATSPTSFERLYKDAQFNKLKIAKYNYISNCFICTTRNNQIERYTCNTISTITALPVAKSVLN